LRPLSKEQLIVPSGGFGKIDISLLQMILGEGEVERDKGEVIQVI
jgi:hypothetical protein